MAVGRPSAVTGDRSCFSSACTRGRRRRILRPRDQSATRAACSCRQHEARHTHSRRQLVGTAQGQPHLWQEFITGSYRPRVRIPRCDAKKRDRMRRLAKPFGAPKMLQIQWFPELFGGCLGRSDKDEVTSSNLVGPIHLKIVRFITSVSLATANRKQLLPVYGQSNAKNAMKCDKPRIGWT